MMIVNDAIAVTQISNMTMKMSRKQLRHVTQSTSNPTRSQRRIFIRCKSPCLVSFNSYECVHSGVNNTMTINNHIKSGKKESGSQIMTCATFSNFLPFSLLQQAPAKNVKTNSYTTTHHAIFSTKTPKNHIKSRKRTLWQNEYNC